MASTEKLNKIRHKRLLLQLDAIQIELDEVELQASIFKEIFEEEFKKELEIQDEFLNMRKENAAKISEENDPVPPPEELDEIKDLDSDEENDIEEKEEKIPYISKLFKKIARFLHPDKTNEKDEKEKLQEEYLKVQKYYEEDNLIGLLSKANELNIKIDEIPEEMIKIIEKNIQTYREKIDIIKRRAAWLWCTVKGNKEEEELKRKFYNIWGIKYE
tara:strand:+ start:3571 stop:4218 length:648 start_codon:yes stop_codon:yes gene_type:complete